MKILIVGGKHRHKYALANRMVKYAEEVTEIPHPFTLISEPDESVRYLNVEFPKDVPNGIFILKSGYLTLDVVDPKTIDCDLIVRLPTDSKELEYQYSMETAPSAKYHPVTDLAKRCIDSVLERQAKTETALERYLKAIKAKAREQPTALDRFINRTAQEPETKQYEFYPERIKTAINRTVTEDQDGQRGKQPENSHQDGFLTT